MLTIKVRHSCAINAIGDGLVWILDSMRLSRKYGSKISEYNKNETIT
jgi:hypothetical protein